MDNKKHHFVPVCYLDHFKQNGHLHYYSKKRQEENFCGVDAICQKQHLYLVTQKSWWKAFEIEKDFFKIFVIFSGRFTTLSVGT